MPAGTVLRYKIGVHRLDATSRFPGDADEIAKKRRMETVFQLGGLSEPGKALDLAALVVWPDNDFGRRRIGLEEGFHVLRTRAFLSPHRQSQHLPDIDPHVLLRHPGPRSSDGLSAGGWRDARRFGIWSRRAHRRDRHGGRIQHPRLRQRKRQRLNGNGTGNWAAAGEVTPTQLGTTGLAKEWRFDYRNVPSSGTAIITVRVREVSSSGDWLTELTRTVNTGVAVNFRIAFPPADGAVVDSDYIAKVYFDKSLGFVARPAGARRTD